MDDEREQLPPEDAERLAHIEKLFEELGQLQKEIDRDLGGVDSDEDNEEEQEARNKCQNTKTRTNGEN